MKVRPALILTMAPLLLSGCKQETELDRCVRLKTAEYEETYPVKSAAERETIRDGQRIFCRIAIEGGHKF